jgi:regulator of extracellular matrix RemA (YlzA/DUF370 family)
MGEFLNIGFDNYIGVDKMVVITQSSSAPIKRVIENAKGNKLIDCTKGRRTASVIFTTDNKIILSSIARETLTKRLKCMKNKFALKY